jgi:hypothetical protein
MAFSILEQTIKYNYTIGIPLGIIHGYHIPTAIQTWVMLMEIMRKATIEWDNSLQRIYYAGYDGRIQTFGKSGSSWWHSWVNDYWNTDEYSSFNSGQNYYYSVFVETWIRWKQSGHILYP